ncbi:Dabb family protein [Bacillus sp. FJAT-49732]|uniref:Dabb family protein n=1 Tax=Lederbergia citrisecunda TaxID=2833583 RepID=A0A942TT10_9BACI|nr:Dabb family protein [Lederbergia citrisecunda]MBS4202351.1 Dabb family protein [Lederbergia citrisecunda]
MYEHMVFFKFIETITPEKEQELLEKLLRFKEKIPGIVELTAGFNVTEEEERKQGYSLGLRVTFENKESLNQYGPHPVHQDFVKSLDGVIENVVVVDYPIA